VLSNFSKAFVIAETIGECKDLCEVYLCLSKAYQGLGDKVQSLDALNKGLALAEAEELMLFVSECEILLQSQFY
jgi:hypothetical protein